MRAAALDKSGQSGTTRWWRKPLIAVGHVVRHLVPGLQDAARTQAGSYVHLHVVASPCHADLTLDSRSYCYNITENHARSPVCDRGGQGTAASRVRGHPCPRKRWSAPQTPARARRPALPGRYRAEAEDCAWSGQDMCCQQPSVSRIPKPTARGHGEKMILFQSYMNMSGNPTRLERNRRVRGRPGRAFRAFSAQAQELGQVIAPR